MSQDQIKLPEPVGIVAPRPDVVDWFSYEPEIGTELHEAATVRRLIAEAVAAERAKNIAALEALNLWDYDDPASSAIAAIQGDQT